MEEYTAPPTRSKDFRLIPRDARFLVTKLVCGVALFSDTLLRCSNPLGQRQRSRGSVNDLFMFENLQYYQVLQIEGFEIL